MAGKAAHEKRLARGRAARRRRASALHELSEGHLHIMDVLSDPGDLSGSTVYRVLINTPKVGEKTVERICENLELWPMRRLGDLSKAKRAELYGALPQRAKDFRTGDR